MMFFALILLFAGVVCTLVFTSKQTTLEKFQREFCSVFPDRSQQLSNQLETHLTQSLGSSLGSSLSSSLGSSLGESLPPPISASLHTTLSPVLSQSVANAATSALRTYTSVQFLRLLASAAWEDAAPDTSNLEREYVVRAYLQELLAVVHLYTNPNSVFSTTFNELVSGVSQPFRDFVMKFLHLLKVDNCPDLDFVFFKDVLADTLNITIADDPVTAYVLRSNLP